MIDLGAKYFGYRSDFTRTSHVGPASEALRRVRRGMLEARRAALSVMKPGLALGALDRTIRDVLEDNGVDPGHLIHASHGIGIEVVEMPWLADQTPDVVLGPNVVMTLELIIGVPGVGAYTIEDDLVITEEGVDVFTKCPVPAYE
jgi:Xaa-Pro aminopeptidase